jgi:phenylacetyl-CoA:acceptor oxidoreductase subunit 1
MVIDLEKCFGCKACSVNCRQGNGLIAHAWRRIEDCGVSKAPRRQRMFLPICCNHCSEPPCLEVCPTGATYRRSDGIVGIHEERCIGCGYCVLACPYRARTVLRGDFNPVSEAAPADPADIEIEAGRRGVCGKCNFCLNRLEKGLALGLRPGQDAEATPLCVVSCSAGALHFGDLDDPESEVSSLIRENRTARLQEEMGSDPSLFFIVPKGWDEPRERREG